MQNNNYNTLHKDIELAEKDYGLWDINFQNGDLKSATDKNSLRTGLIIACLTSWNYLNKKGNPIYETFGNRAYEELKKKKSNMVKYKIQQYFIEVLNRMRRVQNVESLEVYEFENYPNDYFVKFKVIALNDELVNGSFNITTDLKQQDSQIICKSLMPFATNHQPLKVELHLCNEYGTGISGEILYIYTKEHDEQEYKFHKITDPTDEDGYLRIEYKPKKRQDNNYGETSIKFVFRGNTTHNGCESLPVTFNTDYKEYKLGFITEDFTTNNEKESLLFKLEEKSLTDQSYSPVQNETIYIKGDDESFYEAVTNSEGVGKCEIILKKDTEYTVSYGEGLKDTVNVTIRKGDVTIKIIEEPLPLQYINSKISFKLQLMNESNRIIKGLPFNIKIGNETVYNGQTNEQGIISYSTTNQELGTFNWTVNTSATPFYNQGTVSFTTEMMKYSPLLGLNVQKSVNNRTLDLSFDYEYSDDGGYLLFSDIPNEQLRLVFEENKIKVDFHKINQYFEWDLETDGLTWSEQNEIRFLVEENTLADTISYNILVVLNEIEKNFNTTITKTSNSTSFDNLIYEKTSNITNIVNNHTVRCSLNEPLLLESKVCNFPLLSNEKVYFYINNPVLFEDVGVLGDVNTDYTDLNGTINTNVSSTGTNISCSTYADCFRRANVLLTGDFSAEYTLTQATSETGGLALLSTSNQKLYFYEFSSNKVYLSNFSSDLQTNNSYNNTNALNKTIKLTRENGVIKVYIDDVEALSYDTNDNQDVYIAWKTHNANRRNFTFKDFKITKSSTELSNPTKEIGSANIIGGKANLTYSLNELRSGTYYLKAKINQNEISNEAESYTTKIIATENYYGLEYEQINNNTIKFTLTEMEEPVKDKKVRLYSYETGYEKAMYTGNDGTCTFTDVPYGGKYLYQCGKNTGEIQNGVFVNVIDIFSQDYSTSSYNRVIVSFHDDNENIQGYDSLTLSNRDRTSQESVIGWNDIAPKNTPYSLEGNYSCDKCGCGIALGGYFDGQLQIVGETVKPNPQSPEICMARASIIDYSGENPIALSPPLMFPLQGRFKFVVNGDNMKFFIGNQLIVKYTFNVLNMSQLSFILSPLSTLEITELKLTLME